MTNKALKNIGVLTLANGLSQTISIVGALYIPRVLGPESYGNYSTVLAFVALFSLVSFSGLDKVIIRSAAKNPSTTKVLMDLFLGLKILCSVMATLVCLLSLIFISYDSALTIYIAVYSMSLLMNPSVAFLNIAYQSSERLKYMASVTVFQNLLTVSLSILLVYFGYGIMALIICRLFVIALTLLLSYQILRSQFFSLTLKLNWKWDRRMIIQGLRFSALQFFNTLSTRIDIVMLSLMATSAEVGIYALAYNICDKILTLRSGISTSVFPNYAKKGNELTFGKLLQHSSMLLIPSLAIIVIVLLSGDWIILNLIGIEYQSSVDVLVVLIFYLFFNFAVIPFGIFLQSTNHEKMVIKVVVIKSILNIALNYVLYQHIGIIGIAISTL
ncbi:MAG: flippase, partial [Bacteroidota bacterium]